MRGGGVMYLIRKDYAAVQLINPLNIPKTCDCLIIKLNSIASVLVVIHRPPTCSSAETKLLVEAFDSVLSLGYHTTILGDLNLPEILWHSDPPCAVCPNAVWLVELAASWDMSQIVPEPTRGASYLDIILTTSPSAFHHCRTQAPVSSSDHNLVICKMSAPNRYTKQYSGRCVAQRINYDALQSHLVSVDWSLLPISSDIDTLWQSFYSILNQAIASCTIPGIPRPVYVSRKLRALFLRKKRRWRCLKNRPSKRNKERYAAAAQQLSRTIRRFKAQDEESLLRSSPSQFF
jgi:hypothetical protein